MFIILNVLLIWLFLAKGEEDYKFHLPTTVIPTHYILNITPDLNALTFKGDVKIEVTLLEPVSYIVFHKKNLNVSSDVHLEMIQGVASRKFSMMPAMKNYEAESANIHKLDFGQVLPKGRYRLVITEFTGSFPNENLLEGFYRGKHIENENTYNFGTSLCEPSHARQIFPCFDEPNFRATFKIFIVRPLGFVAYSNGNLIGSRYITNCNGYEDEFETTDVMSTYSLIFILANKKMILSKKIKNNINQVLAQSKFLYPKRERYVIDTANVILKEHEKFLKVNCTLEQLIHAAIPSQYMKLDHVKTWRIITYNEDVLLFYDKNNAYEVERCNLIIACEIAHIWFGNLVGLSSWDYTWLNEGFGKYMSYKIINKIHPNWLVNERLLGFIQEAMYADSLGTTVSLSEPVLSTREIALKFNDITRFKGAALIRMMEAILCTKVFRQGLNNYIKNTTYGIASPETLYTHLQVAAEKNSVNLPRSFSEIMSIWDGESEYPTVYVERKYPYIHLKQSQYASTGSEAVWCIPINFASEQNQNFLKTEPSHWLEYERLDIVDRDIEHHHWLIVNKQQAYYYRVNYDKRNWQLLATALTVNYKHFHTLNRMQMIDDSFYLAQIGDIPYSIPLQIIKYIKSEREYGPFSSLQRNYDILKERLRGTPTGKDFEEIIKNNILAVYNYFNEKVKTFQLDHSEILTLDLLTSWLCELNCIICKGNAKRTIDTWKIQSKRLSNLEEYKLCIVIRNANEDSWNNFLKRYINSLKKDESEDYIFPALGCTSNNRLVKRYLVYALTLSTPQILEAFHSVFKHETGAVVFLIRFIQTNFKVLLQRLGEENLRGVLTLLGKKIVTRPQLELLLAVSKKNRKQEELFRSARKSADFNINWKKKYQAKFEDYLHKESKSVSGTRTNLPIIIFFFMFNLFIIKIICY